MTSTFVRLFAWELWEYFAFTFKSKQSETIYSWTADTLLHRFPFKMKATTFFETFGT